MRLVSDWKQAPRWFCVHALALQAAAVTAWASVPSDLRSAVPAGTLAAVCGGIAVLGFVGRLVDQTPKPKDVDDTDQAGA